MPDQLGQVVKALEAAQPIRFILRRKEDVHDFSGPGVVVWGVEWPDGTATYRWNSAIATTVIAASVQDVMRIHGHDGATVLEWVDPVRTYWATRSKKNPGVCVRCGEHWQRHLPLQAMRCPPDLGGNLGRDI